MPLLGVGDDMHVQVRIDEHHHFSVVLCHDRKKRRMHQSGTVLLLPCHDTHQGVDLPHHPRARIHVLAHYQDLNVPDGLNGTNRARHKEPLNFDARRGRVGQEDLPHDRTSPRMHAVDHACLAQQDRQLLESKPVTDHVVLQRDTLRVPAQPLLALPRGGLPFGEQKSYSKDVLRIGQAPRHEAHQGIRRRVVEIEHLIVRWWGHRKIHKGRRDGVCEAPLDLPHDKLLLQHAHSP
mmetsp:Transcript_8619/g.21539  ORF Transcript_8619/g.21539 Transcript_8619/m.21539 type:complete len:236 (-) Transcript_8619:461-1168(-)